jgi:CAAX prenyl protease-like protein
MDETRAANRPDDRHATEIEYCAPAVVFALLTAAEGWAPLGFYPAVYAVKVVAVTLALVACRRILRDIVPAWSTMAPGVVVGIGVFAIWILGELWIPYPHLGARTAYNPFAELGPGATVGFLIVRLYGLVLLVPVFEELLWRSFLIRYATSPDHFTSVPHGTFSQTAFLIVAGASAVSHSEWLVALVTNVVYVLLLKRTRSLFATVVAHATTNALLGVYVLRTASWQLW